MRQENAAPVLNQSVTRHPWSKNDHGHVEKSEHDVENALKHHEMWQGRDRVEKQVSDKVSS